MPREYNISFENVTVTVAQDLVSVKGATGKMLAIKRVRVGATNTTIPTAQMLQIRCRLSSATITLGSGGASGTIVPIDIGDSAASFTARTNDTTKATTSGAFTTIEEMGVHIFGGYDFSWPMDGRPLVGVNEGFVFELLSTVSGTCAFSGGVTVVELGG